MKRSTIIALGFALAGCAAAPPPAVENTHAIAPVPVVIIPGALGSRLKVKGSERQIWLPRVTDFVRSRFDSLAVAIDPRTLRAAGPDVEAYVPLSDNGNLGHERIARTLRAAGYVAAALGEPNRGVAGRYYFFAYDWRRDLVRAAAELDRFIDGIRRDYRDPSLKVDIIAESMGGLVAQYFLRYGSEDVLDADSAQPTYVGAGKVHTVVLIGTPSGGLIRALQALSQGYRLGIWTVPAEIVATMESAYELLPYPGDDWVITAEGKRSRRNIFSAQTWRDFQWSVFAPVVRERIARQFPSVAEANRYLDVLQHYFARSLARGQRFHRALSMPMPRTSVRYTVFGGDCKATPARVMVEQIDGRAIARSHPAEILHPVPGVDYARLMLERGDGWVTRDSLLSLTGFDSADTYGGAAAPANAMLVCERHRRLMASARLRDALLHVLTGQVPNLTALAGVYRETDGLAGSAGGMPIISR